MLVFDGTFYHLWYFPACILGILLVYGLSRFLDLKGVTIVSAVLYVVGLFGDSYFGLIQNVPALNTVYEAMFHVFSYTRNGLFLAPLFLVLGAWAGKGSATASVQSNDSPTFRALSHECSEITAWMAFRPFPALSRDLLYLACLALSFGTMIGEAFVLRYFDLQRHDSMYILLVPVMFFLYQCILYIPARSGQKSAGGKILRTASSWIYILHPALIVVVRGAAKALHLTELLVDNSLLHYITVACLSAAVGFAIAGVQSKLLKSRRIQKRKTQPSPLPTSCSLADSSADSFCPGTDRAWIELDMAALENNVRFLQSCLPQGCRLMPAVKANAYGHGAVPIARELNRLGIKDFCVANAVEGIQLREAGITGQILILGYTHPSQFGLLQRYRLTQAVVDYAYAEALQQSGLKIHVHIAVDTGMHRLGLRCEKPEQIASVYHMKNLSVDGIFTHLSACDSLDPECQDFTESQIQAFYQVADTLLAWGCPCRGLHILSSYGILNYPEAAEDYARPGIALYGVLSTEKDTRWVQKGDSTDLKKLPQRPCTLRPVLSLKARIASVRTLHAGESAGYGLAFIAHSDMRIAVLPIGYADGLPRNLSEAPKGPAAVLINGQRAPIIGRICMDQTLIDVSGIPDAVPGGTAVLIGTSGEQEITVGELAEQCGTITNEILSRLGSRLDRI